MNSLTYREVRDFLLGIERKQIDESYFELKNFTFSPYKKTSLYFSHRLAIKANGRYGLYSGMKLNEEREKRKLELKKDFSKIAEYCNNNLLSLEELLNKQKSLQEIILLLGRLPLNYIRSNKETPESISEGIATKPCSVPIIKRFKRKIIYCIDAKRSLQNITMGYKEKEDKFLREIWGV